MIDSITIRRKRYPVAFNQMTQEVFSAKVDADAVITSAINATVYAALKSGAYINEKTLDLSFGDVVEWIDEVSQKEDSDAIATITAICDEWTNCFWYQKLVDKLPKPKESDKKKVMKNTGLKSTNSHSVKSD